MNISSPSAFQIYIEIILLATMATIAVRFILKNRNYGSIVSALGTAIVYQIFVTWSDGYIDSFMPIAFIITSCIAFAVSWTIYWLFDFFNKKK